MYDTDDRFDKRPPSVLPALLGGGHYPNDVGLLTPQSGITDLSYVGIYPTACHLEDLVHRLPLLRRLFVQLGPSSFDDVALLEERGWADLRALWAERDSTYDDIMLKMVWDPDHADQLAVTGASVEDNYELGNWACLEEFETGDAPDSLFWQEGLRLMTGEWWHPYAAKWKPGQYYGTFVQRKQDEALPIRDSYYIAQITRAACGKGKHRLCWSPLRTPSPKIRGCVSHRLSASSVLSATLRGCIGLAAILMDGTVLFSRARHR